MTVIFDTIPGVHHWCHYVPVVVFLCASAGDLVAIPIFVHVPRRPRGPCVYIRAYGMTTIGIAVSNMGFDFFGSTVWGDLGCL